MQNGKCYRGSTFSKTMWSHIRHLYDFRVQFLVPQFKDMDHFETVQTLMREITYLERGKRLKELGLSSLEKRLKEGIGWKEGCSPENKGESEESI